MILQELSVGNWVCDGEKSIPMYVTSIHRDGTVYLDFPGNEALDWETDVKDLVPIEVTEEMLQNWGFERVADEFYLGLKKFEKQTDFYTVGVSNMGNRPLTRWNARISYDVPVIGNFDFQYVHEFQNHICQLTGHPFEIKEL